jgi:glycosyltransferase involved in cell wall biosynthesis
MKKISIITPCLNEKENLIECCERVKKIFNNELKTFDYEHIIIDNNSEAETYEIIKKLTFNDKKIKAIINNKNYGVVTSHDNGIKFATGDAVITFLSSDLQDPPEIIPKFIEKWQLGYDLVVGLKKTSQEFFMMRLIRKLFYKIISFISGKKIFDGISDYQLIDKKIHAEIKKINSPFFYRTLSFDFTDNYSFIEYEWNKRIRGKSHESFFSYLTTSIRGIMFASSNPFRILLYFSLFTSLFSVFYIINLLISYFSKGPGADPGITLIIVILLIFLSLTLFILGFMGEYIIYIFNNLAKNRNVLIKEKINFEN